MVTAYVLVKAHTGEADRLARAIEDIGGVVDASIVAGDIDIIAKIRVDEPEDVKAVAADAVQALDGVEDTRTYIAMD